MSDGERPRYSGGKTASAVASARFNPRGLGLDKYGQRMPTHSHEPNPTPSERRAQADADYSLIRRLWANKPPEERQATYDRWTSERAGELFSRLTLDQQLGALAAVGVVLERQLDPLSVDDSDMIKPGVIDVGYLSLPLETQEQVACDLERGVDG